IEVCLTQAQKLVPTSSIPTGVCLEILSHAAIPCDVPFYNTFNEYMNVSYRYRGVFDTSTKVGSDQFDPYGSIEVCLTQAQKLVPTSSIPTGVCLEILSHAAIPCDVPFYNTFNEYMNVSHRYRGVFDTSTKVGSDQFDPYGSIEVCLTQAQKLVPTSSIPTGVCLEILSHAAIPCDVPFYNTFIEYMYVSYRYRGVFDTSTKVGSDQFDPYGSIEVCLTQAQKLVPTSSIPTGVCLEILSHATIPCDVPFYNTFIEYIYVSYRYRGVFDTSTKVGSDQFDPYGSMFGNSQSRSYPM
ncbi:hypothetical protein J6590_094955, partial [Homalodisca vitripennis]